MVCLCQNILLISGVPQDFTLGPMLFVLHYNDNAVCNIAIYADDTTLYSSVITFFLLRFTFVSVNLPYRLALNIPVMFELVLLVATSTC